MSGKDKPGTFEGIYSETPLAEFINAKFVEGTKVNRTLSINVSGKI